jgi:hypothetical protein
MFGHLCVAVSVIPDIRPEQIIQWLPRGYMALLSEIGSWAKADEGEADVAHWVLCTDRTRDVRIVHLAYVSPPKFAPKKHPSLAGDTCALVPVDLLTAEGKRELGIAPIAETGPSTEHPVFGLHAGMDRASVLDRLGPPTRSITMGEVLSRFTTVVGTPPSDTEAWLYVDTPPGHEIRVTITADGRLERAEVYVQSSGASKRMWSTDGKRR